MWLLWVRSGGGLEIKAYPEEWRVSKLAKFLGDAIEDVVRLHRELKYNWNKIRDGSILRATE